MAYDFSGSNLSVNFETVPVTATPLTIACWAITSDTTNSQYLVSLSDGIAPPNHDGFFLNIGANVAGDPVRVFSVVNGTGAIAVTSTGITANTWHHVCGVYASDSSRTAYIDGGSAVEETTASTPVGVAVGCFGGLRLNVVSNSLQGRICEVGIWNVALTAAEVLMLARGFSPQFVRPQSLVMYAPLIRTLQDIKAARAITNNGAAVGAHRGIIYPAPPFYNEYTPAAVAAGPLLGGRLVKHGILQGRLVGA